MAYLEGYSIGSQAYSKPLGKTKIGRQTLTAAQAAAIVTDGILNGTTTSNSAVTNVTTFVAQPPYARSITVIAADGTAAHVKADSTCTITGTSIDDKIISEVLTFDENQETAEETLKAFKTISRIVFSAMDGAAKFDVGWGDKIGIPFMLGAAKDRPIVEATLLGVIEATAPTLTADADELEKNLIDLNSALNGTEVCIYYYM